eukprot:gene24974-10635_t
MNVSAFSSASRRVFQSRPSRARVVSHAMPAVPKQFNTITPAGDRVLVKQDKPEARTIGGVLLPSVEQKQSTTGEVASIGKAGERVVYSKFAGTDLDISGDNHVLLKEADVIGKLVKGDKIPKMKPLSDRILIEKAKAAETSAGGVLLSAETAERPSFGKVLAVGPGEKKEDSEEIVKPNVECGETVLYSKYSGTEFEEDGNEYVVVRTTDILAALELAVDLESVGDLEVAVVELALALVGAGDLQLELNI